MLHKRITLNYERFQYYRNFGRDGFKQLIQDQKLPESAKIVDFEIFHGIGGKVFGA